MDDVGLAGGCPLRIAFSRRARLRQPVYPRTILVNVLDRATDADARRVCLQKVALPFEPVRKGDIVGIETSKVRRRTMLETRVQRCDDASIRPADYLNSRITGRPSGQHFRGVVLRAVVDDDDANVPTGLRGDACKRELQR